MWDLMYPRAYRPRSYGSGGGYGGGYGGDYGYGSKRCRACGNPIGIAKLAGGRQLKLNFCENHFCRKLLNAAEVCPEQNNGRSHYCDTRQ